jgi:hypothetical protein
MFGAWLKEEQSLYGGGTFGSVVPGPIDTLHVDEQISRRDVQEDCFEYLWDQESSFCC